MITGEQIQRKIQGSQSQPDHSEVYRNQASSRNCPRQTCPSIGWLSHIPRLEILKTLEDGSQIVFTKWKNTHLARIEAKTAIITEERPLLDITIDTGGGV